MSEVRGGKNKGRRPINNVIGEKKDLPAAFFLLEGGKRKRLLRRGKIL